MWNYHLINRLAGWTTFLIAAVAYSLTIEPSVSFWDCPEFILSATQLEIGHPPGAPVFMLAGNFFARLASNPQQIPLFINLMNAFLSAGCILFLFWTITHLSRKLIEKSSEPLNQKQIITIIGAGFTGALIYTFSDTFWYSAVEGEVYAFSSFLTAVAFWIILKWEDESSYPSSDRWIILLAYIIGLSIGVHLLNLLCLPAIVMVVYYKRTKTPTLYGTLLALSISGFLIAIILYVLIPGIVSIAGYCDLAAVNYLKLPFNTGTILFAGILTLLLIGGIILAYRIQNRYAAMGALCALVFFCGYSSYALILIRANANPPMNQQAVKDPFTLKDYLGREQYGRTPLFYGQTFASPRAIVRENGNLRYDIKEGATHYQQDINTDEHPDRYVDCGRKQQEVYQPETCIFFPRMYHSDHQQTYLSWISPMKGKRVSYHDPVNGTERSITIPAFSDNLRFFLRYQLNFMYWRYFLWNFVGRQDDIQGYGNSEHGNWITGFTGIDNWLTNGNGIPDIPNKGHNVFYGLPLLLGLLGIGWQWKQKKGKSQFLIVFLLFFMTGIAIVIYLNQTPLQPRERDYAYAGSFYAFSIWCGLGVASLCSIMKKYTPWIAVVICIGVPLQMASQTWDDHDRSGRYLCRNMGYNYLSSVQDENNPVLFVYGDNDTFPLWYMTGIEKFRTDVRVCNLMYMSGSWYIEQMMQPVYDSPGLPFSLSRDFYRNENNLALPVNPVIKQTLRPDGTVEEIRIKEIILDFYRRNPDTLQYGKDPFEWSNIVKYWINHPDETLRCIPTDEVHIPVDEDAIERSDMTVPPGYTIPDKMLISLKDRSYLLRPGIAQLDLINSCNWQRPLYIAVSAPPSEFLDLSNHLMLEGLAYRIVPFDTKEKGMPIDSFRMYDNFMNRFIYTGLNDKDVYLDDVNKGMVRTLHLMMNELINSLDQKGENEKAQKVREKHSEVFAPEMLYKVFMERK